MNDLDGKVAIVTGGGGGIGRGEALRMAAEGAAVVVNDFNAAGAEETAAMIRDAGGRAVAQVGDVSRWDVRRRITTAGKGRGSPRQQGGAESQDGEGQRQKQVGLEAPLLVVRLRGQGERHARHR
jgi:NAD(P)-dependent dehydrogenase (short-subunit alcohol dehydrogenase family)